MSQIQQSIAKLEAFIATAEGINDRADDDGDGHFDGYQSSDWSSAIHEARVALAALKAELAKAGIAGATMEAPQ